MHVRVHSSIIQRIVGLDTYSILVSYKNVQRQLSQKKLINIMLVVSLFTSRIGLIYLALGLALGLRIFRQSVGLCSRVNLLQQVFQLLYLPVILNLHRLYLLNFLIQYIGYTFIASPCVLRVQYLITILLLCTHIQKQIQI